MTSSRATPPRCALILLALFTLVNAAKIFAQSTTPGKNPTSSEQIKTKPEDAVASLTSALIAACKQDEPGFTKYLTKENATAFQALPIDQRKSVLRRFSLSDDPGKPLLAADSKGNPLLRCENSGTTSEFRFSPPRLDENLAFVPVQTVGDTVTDFGLVRQSGSWKIISVGLVVFDISQLVTRWAQQEIESRETAAVEILQGLRDAVQRYQRAFGAVPDSLAQLGPAPQGQVSPELANLISADLASGASVGGYKFRYIVLTGNEASTPAYEFNAIPAAYPATGRRSFLLDAQGHLHALDKHGEPATAEDAVIDLPSAQE